MKWPSSKKSQLELLRKLRGNHDYMEDFRRGAILCSGRPVDNIRDIMARQHYRRRLDAAIKRLEAEIEGETAP